MEGITLRGANPMDHPAPAATQQQLQDAAQQFEGLLLHQLLKSSSGEGGGGWLGTGEEDTAGLQAMDMAQEQFAAALAARGGLGLAKLVIPQLSAESEITQGKK